jgi:hypothetical protein
MGRLLATDEFKNLFMKDIKKANQSIVIISPYIKLRAVDFLINEIPNHIEKKTVITLYPGIEYVNGATDPLALLKLQQAGFEVSFLRDLHAKLYIADNHAYMGSANFTTSGFNLDGFGNIEVMLKKAMTKKDWEYLNDTYINKSIKITLSKELIEDLEKALGNFSDKLDSLVNTSEDLIEYIMAKHKLVDSKDHNPYEQFLESLKVKKVINSYEHVNKDYGKQVYKINNQYIVKLIRSKGQESTRLFTVNYRFALSQTGGRQIKMVKEAGSLDSVIMILDKINHFVCLPQSFLSGKVFLEKNLDANKLAWQFQISLDSNNRFLLRLIRNNRNNQLIHDISSFKDKLVFNQKRNPKQIPFNQIDELA